MAENFVAILLNYKEQEQGVTQQFFRNVENNALPAWGYPGLCGFLTLKVMSKNIMKKNLSCYVIFDSPFLHAGTMLPGDYNMYLLCVSMKFPSIRPFLVIRLRQNSFSV